MGDFYIEKKIYYHDTDCGGVVYYANYLKHLEEARAEYCLSKGVSLKELAFTGTYFVVAHVEIDYQSPARYQDSIKVLTRIEKIGNASIYFLQEITKDNAVLVKAKTTWVCVDRAFNPKPIPEEIKKSLL
jgi:acyl-CoA thioester hydrolase